MKNKTPTEQFAQPVFASDRKAQLDDYQGYTVVTKGLAAEVWPEDTAFESLFLHEE
jgi:hypothetical protein